ncbi:MULTISPECIES: HEPN domain-containing protein [Brevibacterium]|uniref:Uncharacterized protein n=1 Tax=Brevibacterium aurantiacum TaxID=273384 RepID=A0A2H1JTG2_BREAU|nr:MULTISPECIES: HEPN domain-containing protein [Brevibacterium]SMX90759.1 hypothetical protein BAURA86_02050 [Brevibacterium aurantiacum]
MSSIEYFGDQAAGIDLTGRKYRITVPLVGVNDDLFDGLPSRIPLGCDAFLVRLDEAESERLRLANLSDEAHSYWTVGHRLEILNVRADQVYEEWQLLEAQFNLVVRRPLTILGSVLDRLVDGTWVRGGMFHLPENYAWFEDFPAERFETLKSLREGMNGTNDAPIVRAADLYSQAVKSMNRGERDNAFILSAVALETLLGYKLNTEISFKLSLRATVLEGGNSERVLRRIRKLYSIRSSVVHSGKHATFTDVTHIQQALMRFVPTMAALSEDLGSYDSAIAHLDELAWNRQLEPSAVLTESGWWSYVPLEACFDRTYGGFDDPDRLKRVWLFDD